MRSFVKIKSSRNGEITQSFTYIGKACLSREMVTSQICLLMLFAKIKLSENFRIYSMSSKSSFGSPGGGGGYSIFFFIRRLGPSIYRSPDKISGISSTPKNILKF